MINRPVLFPEGWNNLEKKILLCTGEKIKERNGGFVLRFVSNMTNLPQSLVLVYNLKGTFCKRNGAGLSDLQMGECIIYIEGIEWEILENEIFYCGYLSL